METCPVIRILGNQPVVYSAARIRLYGCMVGAAWQRSREMGLFPNVRSATPHELEPEPEPDPGLGGNEETAESLRQTGGKQKKTKKGQPSGGSQAGKAKKSKVSREHMLLARLEKMGDAYKEDGDTLVELATLYSNKQSWAQAIHFYKLSLRALPERREAIVLPLANSYFQFELFEEAQFLYQDAVRKPEHVRNPVVWYHLGIVYERQEKYEIAEYCLRHSMTLLPPLGRDVEINCRLATCANQLERPTDAIQSYKSACTACRDAEERTSSEKIEQWISEEFVWFELALMYDVLEEAKLAQRCYSKSGYDASDATVWQKLGREYISLREGERAILAFEKALQIDPENPLLWWSMAEGYYAVGDKKRAVDGVQKIGFKLQKLITDTKRREEEMRARLSESGNQAGAASSAVARQQQRLQELELQLSRTQGEASKKGEQGTSAVLRQKELEVEVTMYASQY